MEKKFDTQKLHDTGVQDTEVPPYYNLSKLFIKLFPIGSKTIQRTFLTIFFIDWKLSKYLL